MTIDLGVHNLLAAYRAGSLTVRQVIDEVLKRIAAAGDDKVWISRLPDATLRAQADTFDRQGNKSLPLFGVPREPATENRAANPKLRRFRTASSLQLLTLTTTCSPGPDR